MRYLSFDSVLDHLSKSGSSVFTVHDVAKTMQKSPAYASLMLSRSRKVKRVSKGIYCLDGASMYEIASNMVYPSYVSLSSALQYYELIDQNILRYSVITTKRHKELEFGNASIAFITLPKGKVFGYVSKNNAYVATIEKMFADCLYLHIPDFEQITSSFSSALEDYKIDIPKLKEYGIKMEKKSLINKLGLLLELNGINADDLLKHIYRPAYIKTNAHAKSKNKKWMVVYD